jgi:threonine aldolase
MFGGGMRQVGVLAAAGLVALQESPQILHRDHENAKHLAEGLAEIPGITIDPRNVATNIVIFDVAKTGQPAAEICRFLVERGVLASPTEKFFIRMVTHCDVTREGIERALTTMASLVRSLN